MGTDDDIAPYDHELDDGSTTHHVDAVELRSLGIVAGLFYLTAFLVLALAVAGVWLFAASLGLISQVEDFMRSVGFRGFRIVGPDVILGFVLILAAIVVFLTVMTLVAGAFYNLLGTAKHGIRFRTTVVEHRGRRPRRVYDDVERPAADEIVAATAPLAGAPAAAVAAAPLTAALDEETWTVRWVRAPGDEADPTEDGADDVGETPATSEAETKSKPKKAKPKKAEATPLVFEPVPDENDTADTNGDGAAAGSDDAADEDEPQKPEAVAG